MCPAPARKPSAPPACGDPTQTVLPLRHRRILKDAIAGCSIAGLLLPEAVAYAGIGNLPPQAGLIGLLSGLVGYGLLGSSRFAVVSATSSSAAVLAAVTLTLSGANEPLRLTLAAALVALAGVLLILAGAARLGGISDFIAKPVLRGFTFGLALTIIAKEFAKVVGVQPTYTDMPRFAFELLRDSRAWNLYAMAACFAALAVLYAMGRWHRLPGTLVVIVLGITAGYGLNLHRYGIAQVGQIDLTHLSINLPQFPRGTWLRLVELAFAIVLVLYAESYGSIRSFATKYGDSTSPNRDLVALGIANLGSGLLHGMPVGAGYSATSANEAAGAQTRLAGWCAAAVIALIVALLLPQLAHTPQPVLAAIVIYAVGHTLNPEVFRPYWTWRRDRLLIVAAVVAVLLLGILDGLLAGVGVSLLLTLRNFSEPKASQLGRLGNSQNFVDIAAHPEARPVPGVLIVRPEAPLFFANAERVLIWVRGLLQRSPSEIHTIIISLEESPDVDGSAVEALRTLAAELRSHGRRLMLVRLKPRALEVLKRATDESLPLEALHELSVDECVQSIVTIKPLDA